MSQSFNFLRMKSASPIVDSTSMINDSDANTYSKNSEDSSRTTQPTTDIELSDSSHEVIVDKAPTNSQLGHSDPFTSSSARPEISHAQEPMLHTTDEINDIISVSSSSSTEDSSSDMSEVDQQIHREQAISETPFTAQGPTSIDLSGQLLSSSPSDTTKEEMNNPHLGPIRPDDECQAPSTTLDRSLPTMPTSPSSHLVDAVPEGEHSQTKLKPEGNPSTARKLKRRSSAPPEYHNTGCNMSKGDISEKVTAMNTKWAITANMPAHAQMLSHLQSWTLCLNHVKDRYLRKQIIGSIAQKFEIVWMNAMRMGLIPFDWQDDMRTAAQAERTIIDVDAIEGEDKDITEQDILEHEWYPRGRAVEKDKDKARKKRPISPAREIVIDTKCHSGSKNFGITAGELLEAGVDMKAVQKRVETRDLTGGDHLFAETLDDLNQDDLFEHNWRGKVERTVYNILGRDLRLYCIWEMQRCEAQLEVFNKLLGTFFTANQIKNTRNRIDAEQLLHDQLLAIALELDPGDDAESDADSDVQEISRDLSPDPNSDTGAGDGEPVVSMEADAGIFEKTPGKEPSDPEEVAMGVQSTLLAQYEFTQGAPQTPNDRPTADIGPMTPNKRSAVPIVLIEHGVKREMEEDEATPETPTKRPRYDYQNNEKLVQDPSGVSGPTELEYSSMSPETLNKQRAYIQFVLIPKANIRLFSAGRPILSDTSSWPHVRESLADAKLSSVAEELWKDLVVSVDNWDIQFRELENGLLEIDDISGYPTKREIFNAIPPEGMTGDHLKMAFAGPVDTADTKYHVLVRSVAQYDGNLWHRKAELANDLRHRLVVSLKYNWNGYRPEDFSSRTVNNTGEFRWLYLHTATIAQRESMDEIMPLYVKHIKTRIVEARAAGNKVNLPYGQYIVLPNPYQQSFDPMAPIVHGLWDLAGRKSTDNRVPGCEWFYEGRDGDFDAHWVMIQEKGADGNVVKVLEREIEGMSTEEQVKDLQVRFHAMQAAAGTKVRVNVGRMGLDGAGAVSKGKGGKKGIVKTFGPKPGVMKGKKGKKGLAVDQTVTMGRARRETAKVVKYVEQDGVEGSDEEWSPNW